ncbi:DgyrCDS727 [Dimorphilus gyrociliatus]|nr:DgyrCDS727 [Dimorphilus gyrociliatus]
MTNAKKVTDFDAFLSNYDTTTLAIAATFILGIITVLIFFIKRSTGSGNSILFMGINNAGKTAIFLNLIKSENRLTITSMKQNEGTVQVGGKSLKIIDLPGNERIRKQYMDQFKKSVKAVFFVVDSFTLPKEVKDVAELLYDILIDGTLTKYSPTIVIVCNKQDHAMAKSSSVIKNLLQKEL